MNRLLTHLTLCAFLWAPICLAHEGHNDAFSEGAESESAKEIEVDEQGIKALGLKMGTADTASVNDILRATGEVKAAETNFFDVNAPVSGAVRAVYVQQNDAVRRGQPLAMIHSIEVAQALSNLIAEKTKTNGDIERVKTQYRSEITLQEKEVQITQSEYQRQESLFKEGIASKKAFQVASNEYEKSKVKLSALRTKQSQEILLLRRQLEAQIKNIKGQLKIMGVSGAVADKAVAGATVTADLPILSPVSGVVTFRDMTLGERVDPNKRLFSIVDLTPIWVMIDVYQEKLPQIHLDQSVKIVVPSGQSLEGAISSIDTNVDPVKKTVHVRVVAENAQGILKPGAFVTAEIVLGSTLSGRVVVPGTAVVERGGKHLVYMRHESHFEPVEVQVGQETRGKIEILSGIDRGDQIVIDGARQLLAQSMIKGHSEEHSGKGHDEHGAHGEHEEAMKDKTRPEVMMVIMFLSGIAATIAAVGAFSFLRRRSKRDMSSTKETRAKIDA
jgi:multidrug efflux pump subunit AcrA (membrane-fusion protein)